jgi:hypothetical protein
MSWVLACNITEDSAKGSKALPASLEGNIRDRQIRVAQQRNRSFDAAREQVTVRW